MNEITAIKTKQILLNVVKYAFLCIAAFVALVPIVSCITTAFKTNEEYASTNQALIELMDSLAADAGEEQLAYLTDVFVNCSRYELGFWDMAWDVQP